MTSRVKVIATQGGRGRVWLDDVEISSKVEAVRVNVRAGGKTKVFLEMAADVEIHADPDELDQGEKDGDG